MGDHQETLQHRDTGAEIMPALEQEHPDILSDQKLGNLLAAVGNHEGKALLLLAMEGGAYYTKSQLHGLITDLPGSQDAYVGSRGNQVGHCKGALEKIGKLVKPDFGDVLRFGITDEGIEIGKPLAAFLIDIGQKYDHSLASIFGESKGKTDNKAPYIRWALITDLLTTNETFSPVELGASLGVSPEAINQQLGKMADSDLVSYSPWSRSKDDVVYAAKASGLSPENQLRWNASELLVTAVRFISERGSATIDEIVENSRSIFDKASFDEQAVRKKLNHSLRQLSGQEAGLIGREGQVNFRYDDDIEMLSDDQTKFWTELTEGLEKIRCHDQVFVEYLNKRADKILVDGPLITSALNRAAEASPLMQNGSEKSVGVLVMKLLAKGGEFSVRDIREQIGDEQGRVLSMYGIRHALLDLIDIGEVDEIEGKVLNFRKAETK